MRTTIAPFTRRPLGATVLTLLAGGALLAAARPAPGRRTSPTHAAVAGGAQPDTTRPRVTGGNDSVSGAYLAVVGGCNDCHTGNWDETMGKTPDADRLAGSTIGYRGPWGTSYAANLRLVVSRIPEDRWVQILTTADGGHGRPPMPWMNTAAMNDADLRALYRYIHALGPKGERTPRPVPPGQEPTTAYVSMVPQGGPGGGAPAAATPAAKSPSAARGSGKPQR
ncbi:MAG TPA: hypothetical protein VGD56_22405 [Gemmatirosa sp.]